MKAGEILKIKCSQTGWLEGELLLGSDNGVSLAIAVDEGIPAPFAIHPELGCQILLFLKDRLGYYAELQDKDRVWDVEFTGRYVTDGKASRFRMITHPLINPLGL